MEWREKIAKKQSLVRMRFQEKNVYLVTFLLLNILVFLIVSSLTQVRYSTSDDHMMEVFMAGAKGIASYDVKFINIILSTFIFFITKWFPYFNWLSVIEELVLIFSFSAISYVIYKKSNSLPVALGINIVFSVYFYSTITYTISSIIGGLGGFLLLFYTIFYDTNSKPKYFYANILIFVSVLLRVTAIQGSVPFLIIVFVIEWVGKYKISHRDALKKLLYFVPIGSAIFLSLCCQKIYYKNWDWEFTQFNSARASVIDYTMPEYSAIENELQELGISQNDYEMIIKRVFDDYEFFDTDLLKEVSLITKNNSRLKDRIAKYFYSYTEIMFEPLFFINIILFVFCFFKTKKSCVKNSLIYIILIMHLLSGYLYCVQDRFPYYVKDAIFAVSAIMLVYSYMSLEAYGACLPKAGKKYRDILILCACYISFFWLNNPFLTRLSTHSLYKIDGYSNFFEIISNRENDFYFMDNIDLAANLYMKSYSVFEPLDESIYSNFLRLSHWDREHPVTRLQLSQYNITSPIEELLNEDRYLVSDTNGNFELFITYFQEHFNKKVGYSLVEVINGIYVYKFCEADMVFEDLKEKYSFDLSLEVVYPGYKSIAVAITSGENILGNYYLMLKNNSSSETFIFQSENSVYLEESEKDFVIKWNIPDKYFSTFDDYELCLGVKIGDKIYEIGKINHFIWSEE